MPDRSATAQRPLSDRAETALTVVEDPVHVEAIGGARLVVGAPLQVGGQLARASIVDHSRVVLADRV